MDVRCTDKLHLVAVHQLAQGRIEINPNDGLDIGLMQTEEPVRIYAGKGFDPSALAAAESFDGIVVQRNECALGTLKLSAKTCADIGSPDRVRLHLLPGSGATKLIISPA